MSICFHFGVLTPEAISLKTSLSVHVRIQYHNHHLSFLYKENLVRLSFWVLGHPPISRLLPPAIIPSLAAL